MTAAYDVGSPRRIDVTKPSTAEVATASPHLKEISARIAKLTYREIRQLADLIDTNLKSKGRDEVIEALLKTSDDIECLSKGADPYAKPPVYRETSPRAELERRAGR